MRFGPSLVTEPGSRTRSPLDGLPAPSRSRTHPAPMTMPER